MGVEHWDRQRALALLRRLHMGNIIVEHLAIAIQPPDRYTTGCTLIGRKSSTTTRHVHTRFLGCSLPVGPTGRVRAWEASWESGLCGCDTYTGLTLYRI